MASAAPARVYETVIQNGLIYDGSGAKPFMADVAIDGDRISYVGPHRALKGRTVIDARGRAVAPGFIDMMGHSEESLLIDGRAVSGLKQGVTLDVFTEQSKEAHPKDWENLFHQAGPDGMLIFGFKHPALKPLIGKTIAEVAKQRGVSAENAIIDLVLEDDAGDLDTIAYTFISEDNIPRQIVLPWVSFGSDAESSATEGPFLLSATHPRAYGNFARLFAKYVREGHILTVEEAVRKLTSLPADVLSLSDRGRLRRGAFADVVVFDPQSFQDHSTYEKPLQYATGVSDVFVNGRLALAKGEPTGAATGRVIRGRAWTGAPGGSGCRSSSKEWSWK
jgi:N-acyl-D-amino-acid deacylase